MNIIPTNAVIFELVKNPDLDVNIVPGPIIASYQSHPVYTYRMNDKINYIKSTLDAEGNENTHMVVYEVQDIRHEISELSEIDNVSEQRMIVYLYPLEAS